MMLRHRLLHCLLLATVCFALQYPLSGTAYSQQPDQDSAQKNDSSSAEKPAKDDPKRRDSKPENKPKKKSKSSPKPDQAAQDRPAKKPKDTENDVLQTPPGVWISPPDQGDAKADFALVGEYAGRLDRRQKNGDGDNKNDGEGESRGGGRLGLQLRCTGNGEFRALTFSGGLPGEEGFQEDSQQEYLGRRHGQSLVLSGGPWALLLNPERCLVVGEDGETLGTLDRVRRSSPTLGAAPPADALVLFNGQNTDAFAVGSMTDQGLLARGADINYMLHDFNLHVEFRVPYMPTHEGQGRGNSGIYMQSRYECQILDSFATERVYNGLGALYRFKPPTVNMAFPPLTWQTYDIRFTAARFGADGSKLRPARVSVWVNGELVQDDVALEGPTGNGKDEGPELLPTKLQDHRDPVVFRNVWAIDRGLHTSGEFPVQAD